jgi:transposase
LRLVTRSNRCRRLMPTQERLPRRSRGCGSVPIKTDDQLDLQALHRVRSRLIGDRTAVINQVRGFLLEHGIAVRQGPRSLRQQLPQILATRTDVLSPRMLRIIEDIVDDWRYLDDRIERVTDEIEGLARTDVNCGRLMTVPGIGPIVASATVAAVGNGTTFAKGRDFAAWLGLVPKQMSTGDRTILGRITKRGSRYLRMLFVQGARTFLLEELGKVQFWTLAQGCGAASALQHFDHRACQQAGADRFDCFGSRTQLRNTHRTGSRVTEQNRSTGQRGSLTSRPGICNSRRGLRVGWRRWRNGLTVTSVIWWHIRPSRPRRE